MRGHPSNLSAEWFSIGNHNVTGALTSSSAPVRHGLAHTSHYANDAPVVTRTTARPAAFRGSAGDSERLGAGAAGSPEHGAKKSGKARGELPGPFPRDVRTGFVSG